MDSIQETLSQLQNVFVKRMDAYQSELQAATPSATVSNLTADFATFRSFILASVQSLQEQINLLAHQVDSLEMHSRRKILLLHGLPELSEEDVTAAVVQAVRAKLGLTAFSSGDISRCHRMGRSSTNHRPRPIIVKLREFAVRNKMWFSKTALKGTGLTLTEFLTKNRHDAFIAARERFGVNKCYTRMGFVFIIGGDGKRHRISNLAELQKIPVPIVVRAESSTPNKTPAPVATRVASPELNKTSAPVVARVESPKPAASTSNNAKTRRAANTASKK